MKITPQSTVGSIVAGNYSAAKIFQTSQIDYCCKGNRSLYEVCQSNGIDYDKIVMEIKQAIKDSDRTDQGLAYDEMPLNTLIEHIIARHHNYVEKQIPIIGAHLVKVCKVHGPNHPELFEIQDRFNAAAIALTQHMEKEEKILFPYVKDMIESRASGSQLSPALFESVKSPIEMMESEHDNEGDRFREISDLSDQYTPPKGACTTYRVTYKLLEEFENDLHLHIHLENNILFPKAIEMENQLMTEH